MARKKPQPVKQIRKRPAGDRALLFGLCHTPQELKDWILAFLGLELPDCTVDPDSTSNPFDFVWEIYSLALHGHAPDGKVVSEEMAYAGRSSYKCVEKGTRLLLRDRGLVPIEQVQVGELCWSGKAWQPITHWIDDGEKEAVTVTLTNGSSLTTSPVHRVWAWEPGATPGWKRVADLEPTDLVRLDVDHGWAQPADKEEFELGYVCGILQGDGCLTLLEKYHRVTLTTNDPYVLGKWQAFAARYGKTPKQSESRPYDWSVFGRDFCDQLRALGLKACYSFEKTVPEACFRNRSRMLGFLCGLFDTDGSVAKDHSLLWPLTSRALLEGCQKMLLALGVYSSLQSNRLYPEHGQKHAVHVLKVVGGEDVAKLFSAGFAIRAKKAQTPCLDARFNPCDSIPYAQLSKLTADLPTTKSNNKGIIKPKLRTRYSGVTRNKISALLDWAQAVRALSPNEVAEWRSVVAQRWVPVAKMERSTAHFFDISVEGDHSYWSDGFVSHNTLLAAVLEVLMVFHHRRDVVHLAAIEKQSLRAQGYVRKFLERPGLRDFLEGGDDNRRTLGIRWYERGSRQLSVSEHATLTAEERDTYVHHSYEVQVVVCTPSGVQGPHAQFVVVDEVDSIGNPQTYQDAKMIPDERSDRNQLPITIYISTRKSGIGLVQKEIDRAPETQLQVRHWNLIDVTRTCPPARHRPELPRLPVYVSDKQLRALGEAEFVALAADQRAQFVRTEAWGGCLQNCRIFAACKGKLATEQYSTVPTLKSVEATQLAFLRLGGDPDTANSQLLSRKPTNEGKVYPRLDPDLHLVTAAQVLAKFTEREEDVDVEQLVRILVEEAGAQVHAGMDFGFSHNFAVPMLLVVKPFAIVFDYLEAAGLETAERVELCKDRVLPYDPDVWPDPADPASIKSFRKAAFRMRVWKKTPGSVMGGIQILRGKLRPTMSEPELLFLDVPAVRKLVDHLSKYHFTKDAQGEYTDIPSEENDDGPDALRYAVMNIFPTASRGILATNDIPRVEAVAGAPVPPEPADERDRRYFSEMMRHAGVQDLTAPTVIRKGRILMIS